MLQVDTTTTVHPSWWDWEFALASYIKVISACGPCCNHACEQSFTSIFFRKMDLLLWGVEGDLIRELVGPFVDLVTVGEEHGQAVLGAYTCPVKVFKEGAVIWYACIG